VLAAGRRVRGRYEFTAALRRGRRAGQELLVLHLHVPPREAEDPAPGPAKAGFVVGRPVGGAVVRNLVRRRLRHLVRDRLDHLPAGSLLVVRALPPAAGASADRLAADLDRALARLRAPRPGVGAGGAAVAGPGSSLEAGR